MEPAQLHRIGTATAQLQEEARLNEAILKNLKSVKVDG
jgi:hypothetical protein